MEENNMKEMRDALKVIRGMVNEELEDLKDISDEVRADFISIRGWCDHALTKPPRNCDKLSAEECKRIFAKEMTIYLPPEATDNDRTIATLTANGVIDALFAPYMEQNGESDGSK